jgi:hypothetical protein
MIHADRFVIDPGFYIRIKALPGWKVNFNQRERILQFLSIWIGRGVKVAVGSSSLGALRLAELVGVGLGVTLG